MKRYLVILFYLTHLWAKPPYLPVSMEIMEEVEQLYQDDKVDVFLDKIVKNRDYPDSTLDAMREEIEAFFESELFLETGAAYLSSLFTERELSEVQQAIDNYGVDFEEANNSATRKLQKLLLKLDPYIYTYVNRRILTK